MTALPTIADLRAAEDFVTEAEAAFKASSADDRESMRELWLLALADVRSLREAVTTAYRQTVA